jgi:ABC-type transport system involved in multi-copper enzyme maturation permease subunit
MNRVRAVAWFTFRELIRSRMMAVWALGILVLCALAYLLAYLSYGDPLRIFMDLGLAGLEAAGLMILLLSLAVTYTIEMEQKAVFLQLTKPLTRGEYLLGRVLGFWLVNCMALSGMALFIGGFTLLYGGHYPLFIPAVLLVMLQMLVLTTLGLSYQMIATSMVGTVLFTFFTFFLGHAASQIRWLLEKNPAPFLKAVLNVSYYVLPNLEMFNLKDRLYDPALVFGALQWRDVLLYTFGYSFLAFLIGWVALEKREFH